MGMQHAHAVEPDLIVTFRIGCWVAEGAPVTLDGHEIGRAHMCRRDPNLPGYFLVDVGLNDSKLLDFPKISCSTDQGGD